MAMLGIAASLLLYAAVAAADSVSDRAAGRKVELAAADAAGWLIFPEKRSGPAEDYAAHPVPLRNALGPAKKTPPLDWLDRWGLVQLRATR